MPYFSESWLFEDNEVHVPDLLLEFSFLVDGRGLIGDTQDGKCWMHLQYLSCSNDSISR